MKYSQKFGRQEDLMTYFSDNATQSINKTKKWMKDCIFPFHKKGIIGMTKNYSDLTLTIAPKVYNNLLYNHIQSKKLRKFLEKKIKAAFKEIIPQPHRFWLSVELLKEYEQRISRQHNCS